jgi:erythromycin esterase
VPATPRLSSTAVRPLPALADDAAHADLGPLDWLDAAVDGARVVAIGESAHFNAESYRLRHLVLRHLVERHGFTAYAMESGFVEGRRVDAWLDSPAGDADLGAVLARGTTSLMGMFTEQRRLLEWMREAGARGTRVRFYGVDTPGSNVSLLRPSTWSTRTWPRTTRSCGSSRTCVTWPRRRRRRRCSRRGRRWRPTQTSRPTARTR